MATTHRCLCISFASKFTAVSTGRGTGWGLHVDYKGNYTRMLGGGEMKGEQITRAVSCNAGIKEYR